MLSQLIHLIGWIGYHVPRKLRRACGAFLGVLWFDVLRFRRKIVLDNLDIAFPELDRAQKIKIGRKSVYNLGANFVDVFILPFINDAWAKENAVIEGRENLDEAIAQGKGVYVLSMHLGNGDFAGSLITMMGYELYLISKFFKTQWFNDIWFGLRRSRGIQFIEPHGAETAFKILKAIKKKALVVFVLDQFMGKPFGIATRFFGRETGTAYGLALFYLKTRSPVVPIYAFEGNDNKIHVRFEKQLELESHITGDKERDLQTLTQLFSDQIEECVRRYPDQWMWVHRRWKKFE